MVSNGVGELDPSTRELLARYGFDAERFERWRALVRRGEAGPEHNRVRGRLEPPAEEDVTALETLLATEEAALRDEALEAIANGELAVVVLAGGMATRFGGGVKALAEALPGYSFLDLKLAEAARTAAEAGARLPVLLMSSFATDAPLREALQTQGERWPDLQLDAFPQFVSLRLTEQGDLFLDAQGRPSPYATGHGDLPEALGRSGLLPRLAPATRYLFVANVDNLGATLDPAVLGAHLRLLREGRAQVSVEVADKAPGDQGGAPAGLDGKLQIVEGFRFPPDFDQDRIPVFNTNTFLFRREALERPLPFDWFVAVKQVEGRTALQFERLLGQATAWLPTRLPRVPRTGPRARFLPVKRPEDLTARRTTLQDVLRARGLPL